MIRNWLTKKTIDTYDKIAEKFSKSHTRPFWVNELNLYKNLINGLKIIDIGCGAGRDAPCFINANFDYTGIDASKKMLTEALRYAPGGKYFKMNFYGINFPNDAFDGFWAVASYYHAPKKDLLHLLIEAKRIIKTGGIGFIVLREKNRNDNFNEGIISDDEYGGVKRYFSFYTKNEAENIIINAGFKILKFRKKIEKDDRKTSWLAFFVKK